jgi:hypothetical protein
MPPLATAFTTAAGVQLAGVPRPTTRVGSLVFTARPAGGTKAWPSGLPAAGSRCTAGSLTGPAGLGIVAAVSAVVLAAVSDVLLGGAAVAQAARAMPTVSAVIATPAPRMIRMGQMLALRRGAEVRPVRLEGVRYPREQVRQRVVEVAGGEAGHCLVGELDSGPETPDLSETS